MPSFAFSKSIFWLSTLSFRIVLGTQEVLRWLMNILLRRVTSAVCEANPPCSRSSNPSSWKTPISASACAWSRSKLLLYTMGLPLSSSGGAFVVATQP